jgi:hypothetical protein
MRKFIPLNVTATRGGNVSEQEPTQSDDPQAEEPVQDLDVSEEQQDDVAGGARSRRSPSIGDSAAQK